MPRSRQYSRSRPERATVVDPGFLGFSLSGAKSAMGSALPLRRVSGNCSKKKEEEEKKKVHTVHGA